MAGTTRNREPLMRRQFSRALLTLVGVLCAAAQAAAAPAERQQTIKNGDATIHVTIRGEGQPIVFIPSMGRGIDDFDDLGRRLIAAGYEIVLPDPRGMGGSTGPLDKMTLHDAASDTAAVVQSIGAPMLVLGHAYGNEVARTVAADHPQLVSGLILLGAGGRMVQRSKETDVQFRRVFDPALTTGDRVSAIQASFFAQGNNAAVWAGGWNFKVAAAQAAALRNTPVEQWWGGGSARMLVLQGTEDAISPPANARILRTQFPDRVTVVDIPNSGHAMLPEQPEKITDAIIGWLRR
jgi:pimeloyl-ACP methyl ester carboxylesterase